MSKDSISFEAKKMKRVLVVVNKWWECEPVVGVLLNRYSKLSGSLGWPNFIDHPHKRPDKDNLPGVNPWPNPRLIYELENVSVEVWCISDLLEHLPDKSKYQSSSEQKMERMPIIFSLKQPDFVIAVGTAGYPSEETENGNVVVGTKAFMYNAHPTVNQNKYSQWYIGPFDKVMEPTISEEDFYSITSFTQSEVEEICSNFIIPPLNPAQTRKLIINYNYVALNCINVTDYKEYETVDKETLKSYKSKSGDLSGTFAKSLETTHGLIRTRTNAPFIFVSGITDRVGYFDKEVTPCQYAQNTTASHNAGVMVAVLLKKINHFYGS